MKTGKRILAILLAVILTACSVPYVFSAETTYKEGDLIQFGTYPQTRVDETETLKAAVENATWKSYDYYSLTCSDDGDEVVAAGDWMQFADFFCDGEKYRAVKFEQYRPSSTTQVSDETNSFQDDNGYMLNTVYYFKYEPLVWQVLDPDCGFIICESIIDSQAFQNNTRIHFKEDEGIYAQSSIRAWLNNAFYESAFNDTQKEKIENTFLIDNPDYNYSIKNGLLDITFNKVDTSIDKVFILSDDEILGLSMMDTAMITDYALNQGIQLFSDGIFARLTRSGIMVPDRIYGYPFYHIYSTTAGVRPACCLRKLKNDSMASEELFSEKTTPPSSTQQRSQSVSDFVVLPVYYIPNLQGGVYNLESPTTIEPAGIDANGVTITYSPVSGTLVDKSAIPAVKTIKLFVNRFIYDGKRKTPDVTVRDAKGTSLEKGKDFTLKYSTGRKAIGVYQVTVTFKGNYTGSKTLKFKITPEKVTDLKATPIKGAAKLNWKSVKGATHYIVYYSSEKNGTYKQAFTTKDTAARVTGLTSGKSYYFRVRAITKLSSDTNVQGSVSAIKRAKIK